MQAKEEVKEEVKEVVIEEVKEVVKKISDIKKLFDETQVEKKLEVVEQFKNDSRVVVQKLILSAEKQYNAYLDELERCDYMLSFEQELYDSGAKYIAGVDEVGRGPLAGPVVTCAVVLKRNEKILYANDSKKLSKIMREKLYDEIMEKAVAVQISVESVETIDKINILEATKLAMKKSVEGLAAKPCHVLVDATTINIDIPQTAIIKGDEKSMSIACASIVAKVYRDRMMESFNELYPNYCFDKNKGYGSADHIKAIKEFGITPIHRKTFVKNFI